MKHRPRVLGDVGCRSSGWTRDFTSTKCTLLLLFTNTQQSFKCSSFIKREEGGERGKLKTKTRRIKQKQTNNPPQNIEKQNKREKQTQVYRSETTGLTESHTVCGMYSDYRGDDAEGGLGVTFVFLSVPGAWLHAPTRASASVHTHPTHRLRIPTHTHTLAHSPWLIHTQTRPWTTGGGRWVITSPRLPLCNNQGRYHQRGPGRGTSVVSLWRRLERWSQIPSSLSSFSVFGLQDPLVTVQ